ncbi:MAG TPA: hypothetical protein DIT10_11425 [Chryseobacterium sp.]|nr:hypothetical protein [Chryseobacterium sp.]
MSNDIPQENLVHLIGGNMLATFMSYLYGMVAAAFRLQRFTRTFLIEFASGPHAFFIYKQLFFGTEKNLNHIYD